MSARRALRRLAAPAARDALAAALVVVCGGIVFVQLDSVERLGSALLYWERFEVDDLLLTGCLAVAAISWFAWRRWRDATRELAARQRSEEQNRLYVRRLEQLSSQLLETEQDTRARLSELLHDEVGQLLYAGRLSLERLEPRIPGDDNRVLLEDARQMVDDALTRTRDLTFELSPPVLDDLGLREALQWLAEHTEQRSELRVCVVQSELWNAVPRAWHAPIFQSVRELVRNADRHAAASSVEVSAARSGDGRLHITVRDDGRGFVYERAGRRGFGLFSTERRMAWLGAALRVDSEQSCGTSVTLELPGNA